LLHQAGVLIYHHMMHGNMKLKNSHCRVISCVRSVIREVYSILE